MAEKKISFKEAKLAAKETEGSVPQRGLSFASGAASGISTQHSVPLPISKEPKTFKENAMQFGSLELPEDIHAEALALNHEAC